MKRKTALILAALMLAALLAGCDSAGKGGSGTSITIGDNEWGGIDAYQMTGSTFFHHLVADTLIVPIGDGTFGPGIATGYSVSEDGKTIRLDMPEDFKFADGTLLTPQDVKRSVEWGLEVSPFNIDYIAIQEIDIEGNTLIFTLDQHAPSVIFTMASSMPVIQAKQLDSMTAEELLWGATPYGAYSLVEYVEGSHLTLKANPHYKTNNPLVKNKGVMPIETINIRFFNDEFALTTSVKAGEVDITYSYPEAQLDQLDLDKITVQWSEHFAASWVCLNRNDPLFTDESVRQAMAHLVDRDAICDEFGEKVRPVFCYLAPGVHDYSDGAANYFQENYMFDKEKGISLLSAAGWEDTDGDGYLDKDGNIFSFTLDITDNSSDKKFAEVLQILLRDCGIKMEIAVMDYSSQVLALAEGAYQASSRSFSWNDPSAILPYIVEDPSILLDDQYYDLVYAASANPDNAQRAQGFADAQILLMDTLCMIPVMYAMNLLVYSDRVEGIYLGRFGQNFFNDIVVK